MSKDSATCIVLTQNIVIFQAEENERSRIENEKETERRKATEDLERWKEEQRQKAEEVMMK